MSFAINPSLNHIDIPEAFVYELYRSPAEVLLPDARFHGHTCEAYICITKIEKTVKAYVALLEMGMKTVFVYTSDHSASEPAKYPEVYAEAEAFVKEMGFEMEPVNLGFSPAMREVIIKGFRVMRPPSPKKQLLRQTKQTPFAEPRKLRETTALPPSGQILSAAPNDAATEMESLQRELASAKAAIAQITREKVLLEQSASLEIASLKVSCEQAVEAKRKAAGMFAEETEKLKQGENVRANRLDNEEKSALRADLKAVTAAARAAENRLQEKIASLQQKTEQLESDKLALEHQFGTVVAANTEQVRLHAAEKESLLARFAADERSAVAVADKIASLELLETSWKEGQQREEDLCRNLDLMHNQIEVLTIELQSYKERECVAAELQTRVNSLEQELAAAKAEIEIAGSRVNIPESVTAELKALREEKLAVEAEYVRLANESREKELEMLDTVATAEMEIERLGNEMEIQKQVAVMEHEALRAELRKLVVARKASGSAAPVVAAPVVAAPVVAAPVAAAPVAAAPVAAAPVAAASVAAAPVVAAPVVAAPVAAAPVVAAPAKVSPAGKATTVMTAPTAAPAIPISSAPDISSSAQLPDKTLPPVGLPAHSFKVQNEPVTRHEADDEPDRPIVADKAIVSRLMNEFGGFSGSYGCETTEFSINPLLTSIAYSDPEEIEALLYSINTVQAVPDSSSIQRCKGYVVATKQKGTYNVYVAWYLTESKRVVICTPQQQPADSEECVRILQDAVAYFEIVGFMMEVAELGDSVSSYKQAMQKAPVFSRAAL